MIQFFVNGHTPKIISNRKVKESMTTDGHIYVGRYYTERFGFNSLNFKLWREVKNYFRVKWNDQVNSLLNPLALAQTIKK